MPVFLRLERLDLRLPVADHARSDGLHAARGQALLDLHPQQRADLVAHQAVEHAARLLRIDQLLIDGARLLDGALDRLFRDLVEFHAARAVRVDAQDVRQVPGDRLALAVRVGRENDGLGASGLLADALEHLAAAPDRDILGFKVVLNIDAQLGLGQVADVAVGGLHLVRPAQELGDGARLGGRLHNHQLVRRLMTAQITIPPLPDRIRPNHALCKRPPASEDGGALRMRGRETARTCRDFHTAKKHTSPF